MALRLRRVLSLQYPLLHHSIYHPRPIASISSHLFSLAIFNPTATATATAIPSSTQLTRPFTSTSTLFRKTFDPETDEIGPDSILFEGCDYNHWLITVDFPKDSNLTREQMIETYVNIAAQVFGSVEEAKKNIYALSTTTYQGFQVLCSEETSEKFKNVPGVVFVLPDSYIDPVNKEYGGDKYVNGEIFPRPPPVHYGRRDNRDVRRRDNYGPPQRTNYGPPQRTNYGPPPPQQNRGPSMQPQNCGPPVPPQNYGSPTPPQNHGPPAPPQNRGPPAPPQNYGPPTPPQNYGPPTPPQNYGPPMPPPQNYGPSPPPPQNYGPSPPPPQNYGVPPPHQKYGSPPQQNHGSLQSQPQQNYEPSQQQNYGPSSRQNSGPQQPHQNSDEVLPPQKYGLPPHRNHGSPLLQQNYEPSQQQNYGPSSQLNYGPPPPHQNSGSPLQQSYGNYSSPPPQQSYVPQGSGDRRSFTSPSNAYQGNFNQTEPGNRYDEGPRDYQQGNFQSHVSPEQRGFAQDATYGSSGGGRVEQIPGGQRNFSSTGNN